MRSIEIAEDFALHLARLRALARRDGWAQAPGDGAPTPVRVVELEAIEQGLGFSLPDPAIAYIAAGVSCWGDGPVRLSDVLEKTLFVQESVIEAGSTTRHCRPRPRSWHVMASSAWVGSSPTRARR
jgi:hypothetical protein